MEYVDGITLRELMAQRRPELSEAIDLTIQVGTALVAAHAAGIIHRDIKPENIMIRNDGYVKVLDFGLAKLTERLEEDSDPQSTAKTNVVNTEPGMMMGTPAYMSPEQARGLEVDGRTDIWSLGVMFYELITGWTPFHGSTHMDVIAGILKEEPTPIAEHIQDIPPCLEKVLRKMLSKNKDERYLSGAAMVADLERLKRDMRIQPSGEGRNDLRTGLRPNTWNAQSLRWSLASWFLTAPADILRGLRVASSNRFMASRALAILFVTLSLGLAVTWLIHYLNKPTSHQPKAEAVEQYNMGLTAWLAGDLHSAAFALDKAVTLDDQFPLAHARLAQVWSELDYPEKGEHELSRLTSLVPNQSVLPEVDALYLDAIKASVANDFSRAANRYEAITRLSPREEIAFASLGYAYEMNGELAKSAAAYLEATARDPGSPALMLRLGIVYGKQKDLGKASTAFDRADQLYKASRHSKGQIEVLIQRGVLAQKLQQTQEASRYYKQIFQTIRSTDGFEAHEFQTIRTLFHVASRLYPTNKDKGQEYERGAIDWAQDMDRSGLLNHGADELLLQGLVDLGNQFLVNEDLDEARSRFNRAKRIAERSGLIRGMARVRFALGQLSLRDGATLQADSYFKEVLETEFQIRNLSYDSIEQWRKEILGVDYETAVLIFRKRFVESH